MDLKKLSISLVRSSITLTFKIKTDVCPTCAHEVAFHFHSFRVVDKTQGTPFMQYAPEISQSF